MKATQAAVCSTAAYEKTLFSGIVSVIAARDGTRPISDKPIFFLGLWKVGHSSHHSPADSFLFLPSLSCPERKQEEQESEQPAQSARCVRRPLASTHFLRVGNTVGRTPDGASWLCFGSIRTHCPSRDPIPATARTGWQTLRHAFPEIRQLLECHPTYKEGFPQPLPRPLPDLPERTHERTQEEPESRLRPRTPPPLCLRPRLDPCGRGP